ncbi:integrase [Thioclava sp. BHET1]|nr:integrase [Thioclava sp. BHET1]
MSRTKNRQPPTGTQTEAQSPSPALPAQLAGSGALDRLVDTARGYAENATAETTRRAYAADWRRFARWCRRHGADPLPPDPALIGLYLTHCAAPADRAPALSVASIERHLSGLTAGYRQRGFELERGNRHIVDVLAGIRRQHGRPPQQKAALSADDLLAMVDTLDYSLRGLRDRALLLVGFAGGLRRSELVSLDCHRDDTPDSLGWVDRFEDGLVLSLRGKTGWREVEIGRGSAEQSCPVAALDRWLHYARIEFGPLFCRVSRDNKRALAERLSDKHVARLVKQTVLAAGLRPELSERERAALYSGHSLRAGLASSAEIEERYVQKQLGHASVEMTRRYQRRRDRFRINLTKAAGL